METDTDGKTMQNSPLPLSYRLRGSLLHPDGDISRMQCRFLRSSLEALQHDSNFFLILVSIQMAFWWISGAGSEIVTPSTTSQKWPIHRQAFARLSRGAPAHWDVWSTGKVFGHGYKFSQAQKMKMSPFKWKTQGVFTRWSLSAPKVNSGLWLSILHACVNASKLGSPSYQVWLRCSIKELRVHFVLCHCFLALHACRN